MMRPDGQPKRLWSAALAHTITEPVVAVVMGVSGSGKTTVSALLAAAFGCQFREGDDLHSDESVEMLSAVMDIYACAPDRDGNH
jgi:uridine kinase